jgi:hypothetical protein
MTQHQTQGTQIKQQLARAQNYVGPDAGGTASLESARKRAAQVMSTHLYYRQLTLSLFP